MRRTWRERSPPRQRGIALLVAIMLVALGTIVAAAVAYESAMTARRGAAMYSFDEGLLIAEGAEAIAAYALREDSRTSRDIDYPGEAWGQPLGPLEVAPGAMLEAGLEDLQGRFNLNLLIQDDGKPDPQAVAAFQHLLEMLDMEPKWANFIIDWIDPGIDPQYPDGAEDSVYMGQTPPYRTPNLLITSTSELLALPGFGRDRYIRLAPYVTALPRDAKLNVCSAQGFVLDAFIGGGRREFSIDSERLQKARASACFPKMTDYQQAFDSPANFQKVRPMLGQTSNYFRLTSLITIGTTEFNLYSLLYRDPGGQVRPLMRSYTPD